MPLDFSTPEAYEKLSLEQRTLYDELTLNQFPKAFDQDAPSSFLEAHSRAKSQLENKLGDPEVAALSDEQKQLQVALQDPENLKVVLEALDYAENTDQRDRARMEAFYSSDEFAQLYQQAKALKKPGERVRAVDVGKLLENGTEEQKNIFKILSAPQNLLQSQILWSKSEIWLNDKTEFEAQEKNDIKAYFAKLADLPPEIQNDVAKLIAEFEKQHPQYQNKGQSPWYQDYFKEQLELHKDPQLKRLHDWYNSPEFKEIYNHVSVTIGKAPLWSDMVAELKKRGRSDILALAASYEKQSIALWNEQWEAARKDFDRVENEEFAIFLEEKSSPQDWEDLEALAEAFQQKRKRFAGEDRRKWYRQQLETKLKFKETEWRRKVDDFYDRTLPKIYDQIATSTKNYVRFPDIIAHLKQNGQEDLAYLLSEKFSQDSTKRWDTFWQREQETFNEQEKVAAQKFFQNVEAQKLDDPNQLAAQYEADTKYKANSAWWREQLKTHSEKTKAKLESQHQVALEALPDKTLASTMHRAYKKADTFAQRVRWLEENQRKVAEYTPLINRNQQVEAELATRTEAQPDLKKEFKTLKNQYQDGRKNYTADFFSPRKYAERLTELKQRVVERERLSESTITRVENKTFSQVPDLEKKPHSFEAFREALKAKNFYQLDAKVRKNPAVRAAVRTRTKQLHEQWQTARALSLEQDTQRQIDISKRHIRQVSLPDSVKKTAGIKDLKAFTLALKEAQVYKALPPGMIKNEVVRKEAHQHNQKLFAQYLAQPQKEAETSEKTSETLETPELQQAKKAITDVKLTNSLQTQMSQKLKDKDASDPDTFTVALRELQAYGGVDKSLWQNKALRELAWQQNVKLQQQYLAKTKTSTEAETEDQEMADNYGLPENYNKIDWKKLNGRLKPEQRDKALVRFKQMHHRSDLGLQSVMQSFHAPLGTFVLETLAIMGQDRFDKAVNALKDLPTIQPNNREDASTWLRTLCESAGGVSYFKDKASSAWDQLQQDYSSYFGQSMIRAWELEDDLEAEVAAESETDDNAPAFAASGEVEDIVEEKDDDGPQTTSQGDDDLADEDAFEVENKKAAAALGQAVTRSEEDFDLVEEESPAHEANTKADGPVDEAEAEPEAKERLQTEKQDQTKRDDAFDQDIPAGAEATADRGTKPSSGIKERPPVNSTEDLWPQVDTSDVKATTPANRAHRTEVEAAPDVEAQESQTPTELEDEETEYRLDETLSTSVDEEPVTDETKADEAPTPTPALADIEDEAALETPPESLDDQSLDNDKAGLEATTKNTDELESDEAEDDLADKTQSADQIESDEAGNEDRIEDGVAAETPKGSETLTAELTDGEPEESEAQAEPDEAEEEAIGHDNLREDQGMDTADSAEAVDSLPAEEKEFLPDDLGSALSGLGTAANQAIDTLVTGVDELADEPEAEADENEDMVLPEPESIPLPEPIEAQPEVIEEIESAYQQFKREHPELPVIPEYRRTKKAEGLGELSEILAELSVMPLEDITSDPMLLAQIRNALKQHATLHEQVPHFFTAAYQEQYVGQSLTVTKFLQQLQSYIEYTSDVKVTINYKGSDQLSREQGQTLLNAFASRFHRARGVNKLNLDYQNGALVVTGSGKHWRFEV